jgi:methionyl aminopeptidase
MPISIKSDSDIEMLDKSGKILSWALGELQKAAVPGATLSHLDRFARDLLKSKDAKPAFLNYQPEGADRPYPAAICASLNEVIVHGIPTDRELKVGDILKIDLGVDYKGYFTDSAVTVIVGGEDAVRPSVRKLVKATKEALYAGIDVCLIGNRIGDIGVAISKVAKKYDLSVAEGLAGHGVGFSPHEDPIIPNEGHAGKGALLKEGMVIALEPMFCLGRPEIVQNDDDAYETEDMSISAHFEHTIAITPDGPRILTA